MSAKIQAQELDFEQIGRICPKPYTSDNYRFLSVVFTDVGKKLEMTVVGAGLVFLAPQTQNLAGGYPARLSTCVVMLKTTIEMLQLRGFYSCVLDARLRPAASLPDC